MTISSLSEQFSFLTISQESPIDLATISRNQKMVQHLPNAQFWCLAAEHFFKDQQPKDFPSNGLVRFSRKKIQPIIFLNVNVAYEELPSHLRKLHKIGINLNNWKEEGFTLLHLAAITGNHTFIKEPYFDTINNVDKKGRTALHLSAFFGHDEIAKKLITYGASSAICAPIYGSTLSLAILGKEQNTISFFKDLEIEKAKPSSPPRYSNILISAITDDAQRLYCSKCYLNPHRKEIFEEQIRKSRNPELLKTYYAQEKIRRTFYHSWKIDWRLKIDSLEIPHKIYSYNSDNRLEFSPKDGGYSPFFLHKMAKSTTHFATLFKNSPNFVTLSTTDCLSTLAEALDFAVDQNHLPTSVILDRIQSKIMTILSIRVPKHAINAVFYGRFFALCNRGHLTRKSIEIFYFDNTRLTEDILQKMISKFESDADYNNFFFHELKWQLRLYQLPMEKALENLLAMPYQLIPNCAWDNGEAASYMVFHLKALENAGLLNINKFTAGNASNIIATTNYQFYNWLLFQQLEHLENYLKMTTAPDRTFVSNHEMYLETAKLFLEKKHSKLTHPYLFEQMLAIEKRYPEFVAFYKFLRK